MRGLIGCCSSLLLLTSFAVSAGESLPDPTRPPSEISVLPASGVPVVVPLNTGLQSIIIAHDRRAAIINGQLVKKGDRVNDATLTVINESSVVLEGAKGRQVLALFPGVEIRQKETALPHSAELVHKVKKKPTAKKRKSEQSDTNSAQIKKNEGEVK